MVYQYLSRLDGTNALTMVTEGCRALFNVSPEALMADANLVFSNVHPDDLAPLKESIAKSALDLTPWVVDYRVLSGDQSIRWLNGNAMPVRLADGSTQWSGFLSDITERKRIEEATNTANLAKSDFLSSMSHEIRSPLNAILGLAYLLEQLNLGPDANGMVRKIRASGRMLLSLISDILDVSKIEAGQMMIEQTPFRVADVIDNLAVVLGVAVGEKDIELLIKPPPPGVYTLTGDALRLEQVLLNLSINAIKFTPKGKVEVTCELLSSSSDNVVLRFSVSDTGIGIEPGLQDRVFAAFTQADSSTTRRFGGTGLGLTICRQLVQLMGGDIGMTSVLGQGSEFWFTVPLKKVALTDDLPNPTAQAGTMEVNDPALRLSGLVPGGAQGSLQGVRVLVVDDSEINREVARRILHGYGAVVSLAVNGQEALDWLQAHASEVDLVLMDVQMPVMDGIEATRQLRRLPEFANLPIVALTAGAFKAQQDAAHAAGMTHFISKPFDVPSTIALIRRLINRPINGSPKVASVVELAQAADPGVLDTVKGLEIWGSREPYQDYLQRFVGLYSHAAAEIESSLARADQASALALAHKLAGVAANMALPQTYACAAELERVLHSGGDPALALARLGQALAEVLRAIERMGDSFSTTQVN
jgi:signal transduction histidine kinase/CheY-like chemotaxis protein